MNNKVLFERYNFNGFIETKVVIVSQPKKSPNAKQLPVWVNVLIPSLVVFLSIILVTAVVVVWNGKRPGLYGEDCIGRSCETKLGLKCINSTCLCQLNQYYLKKCNEKKSFGETCHNSIDDCKSGMICFNGKCGCYKNTTWSGVKCIQKGSFEDVCDITACDDTKMLSCDSESKFCMCNSERFWSGKSCILKKNYGELCYSKESCNDGKNLICTNGICQCDFVLTYLNNASLNCSYKKNVNEACSENIECLGDMICSSGKCECINSSTHYFNESSLFCVNKTLNNTECSSSLTCRNDLGLSCILDLCQCDTVTKYWDGTSCVPYKFYSEACTFQHECSSREYTDCIGGTCVCNSTIKYFDTSLTKCVDKKNESISCFFAIECYGDMNCVSGFCLCLDTNTHYFNSTYLMCESKTLNNTECASNNTCRSDLGLSCESNLCQCDSLSHYWDSTVCTLYQTYGQACSSSILCDPHKNLVCSSTNLNCSCNSTMYYNSSTLSCNHKKSLGEPCVNDYECNELDRLFCSVVSQECVLCPTRWKLDQDYCYFNSTSSLPWLDAENWCSDFNGALLSFYDSAELDYFKIVVGSSSISDNIWVGLRKVSGIWLWSSNNEPTYTSLWKSSEPSGANKECARTHNNQLDLITDSCLDSFSFICQIK